LQFLLGNEAIRKILLVIKFIAGAHQKMQHPELFKKNNAMFMAFRTLRATFDKPLLPSVHRGSLAR
jgi:hypothetical protein